MTNGAFAAGKPRQFFSAAIWMTGNQRNFDVSRDGKRVVASPLGRAESSLELVFLLNFFDEVRRRAPDGK